MRQPPNPYKASAGVTPPLLVGRDDVLRNYFDAIEGEPGDLERLTLLQGPRGIGKTALLTTIGDQLRGSETYGPWRVFDETATPGFVGRLTRAIAEDLEEIGVEQVKKRSEFSWLLNPVTVKRSSTEMVDWTKTFRDVFTALCDAQDHLNRQFNGDMDAGILVTLDEIHQNNAEEVRQFAAAVQHLVREGRNISVVIAGIPQVTSPLLSGKTPEGEDNPVTFLRRMDKVDLGAVSDDDVRQALECPAENVGVRWDEDALESAVQACGGYPFMVQLVGMYSYRAAEEEARIISPADVEKGVATAQRKIGNLVHAPALDDLSDVDRTFLVAMSRDDGPSKIGDIVERVKPGDSQYINTYRRRLIDADMIRPARYGYVDFTMPYMREYLRGHAAHYGMSHLNEQQRQ